MPSEDSNPRPMNCKSHALPTAPWLYYLWLRIYWTLKADERRSDADNLDILTSLAASYFNYWDVPRKSGVFWQNLEERCRPKSSLSGATFSSPTFSTVSRHVLRTTVCISPCDAAIVPESLGSLQEYITAIWSVNDGSYIPTGGCVGYGEILLSSAA